jgi:2'-5' RNA ligase
VKGAADGKRIIDAIGRLAETDFGSFEASSVVLKKSMLTREGPVYTDLYELEL